MKTCARCGVTKSRDDFYNLTRASNGKQSWCKACAAEDLAQRWRDNPEYRRKGLARSRARAVRQQFGLTVEDLEIRRAAAEGCAICGSADVSHADHDHAAPGLRGFLCQPCNMGLGLFKDNPDRLRAAAEYLDAAPA